MGIKNFSFFTKKDVKIILMGSFLNRAIEYSFYALFFFVPLILYPNTYELFEFNKMVFVYLLTAIILFLWLLKMLEEKRFYIQRTPFDLPLMLFLLANVLSTIFSIERHTSIFGYYSRFNGGLLSTVCYITLYYALVSNLKKRHALKILYVTLASASLAALWGVLEHWGIDEHYWAEDVKGRVFSTLGQANWLAAFLAMLLPLNLSLMMKDESLRIKLLHLGLFSLGFMAFTFTYSRGAALGLIVGLGIFAFFLSRSYLKESSWLKNNLRWISLSLAVLIIVNLIWGNAFYRESPLTKLNKLLSSKQPIKGQTPNQAFSSSSQAENGGTESGSIRLIVWKGVFEIFKHYPILGTGVETFAFSYPQFRPKEHNLTSEWDYLYNKAHDEYFNYLATEGLFGLGTYLFLIGSYLFFALKQSWLVKRSTLLELGLLSGFVSYLVQNFFSFSVVPIALLFFTFPALHLLLSEKLPEKSLSFSFDPGKYAFVKNGLSLVLLTSFLLILVSIMRYWFADLAFSKSQRYAGESGYRYLRDAVNLNPIEPFYRAELGYSAASYATLVIDKDQRNKLAEEAVTQGKLAIQETPNNLGYWKTLVNTYNTLGGLDSKYLTEAISAAEKTSEMAPTEAKVEYNLALLYLQANRLDQAVKALEKTIYLKDDYREAHLLLAKVYFAEGNKEKAIQWLRVAVNRFTDYQEAQEKLKEWTSN